MTTDVTMHTLLDRLYKTAERQQDTLNKTKAQIEALQRVLEVTQDKPAKK